MRSMLGPARDTIPTASSLKALDLPHPARSAAQSSSMNHHADEAFGSKVRLSQKKS